MDFNVQILGSGAAFPTLNRGSSAQIIRCKQRHILIDCGEGTQLLMRQNKIKFQKIQLLLISHLHGDHILGLPGLFSTMHLLGRTQPLKIIGPKGIKKFVLFHFSTVEETDFNFEVSFQELPPEATGIVFEDNCITISTFPLKHRIATQGYKIEEKPGKRQLNKAAFDKTGVSISYIQKLLSGEDIIDNQGRKVTSKSVSFPPKRTRSYAYCCDTAFNQSLLPYIQNVDLLYHDATFRDKESNRAENTYHSTAKQAASIALKAGAKRLILGHFSARYKDLSQHLEEAKEIFDASFLAHDGEVFNV